ncbi:uncharacterized protein LOC129919206 [Episyrphus balteatus]|uniref:uncharacterized protein LOC129919206 n=1 Tax=Episyrphus balteatus TaxID=286459 RepID=UPI002484FC3E|nr:uncharacterized protein LOC129919206 [Episyrphus balteatus]
MKFLLLACVVVSCFILSWSQLVPSPPEAALSDASKNCMVKENVDSEAVFGFKSGKIRPEDVSAVFKCFVRCVVEAKGYMKDGELLEENVVKAAENITSVEQVRKIISNCKVHKGSNVCETSFNIYMCISSELK